MHDVHGQVEVINSSFIGNTVRDTLNNQSVHSGGGGLYIKITRSPGDMSSCTPGPETLNDMGTMYFIKNCVFQGNTAINGEGTEESHIGFRSLTDNESSYGKGGGIYINMKGSVFLIVQDCTFHNNSALWGGGIFAVFQDTTNSLYVNMCTFENNTAPLGSGGALQLYYDVADPGKHNFVLLDRVQFIKNSAGLGGALSCFTRLVSSDMNNSVSVRNCAFVENSAEAGAVVYFKPIAGHSLFDFKTKTLFYDCSFSRNEVVNVNSLHTQESGVMDVESFQVDFLKYVSFNVTQPVPYTQSQ